MNRKLRIHKLNDNFEFMLINNLIFKKEIKFNYNYKLYKIHIRKKREIEIEKIFFFFFFE